MRTYPASAGPKCAEIDYSCLIRDGSGEAGMTWRWNAPPVITLSPRVARRGDGRRARGRV